MRFALASALLLLGLVPLAAQDRLKTMPGYDRYKKMASEIPGSYKSGALAVTWGKDGKTFDYRHAGKSYRYDLASREAKVNELVEDEDDAPRGKGKGKGRPGGVARGRQAGSSVSPDGKWRAVYRDRNLYLRETKGGQETTVTTEGSEKARVKFGTASWVYGEELDQHSAMWWAPDGKRLAFYRFDESKVKDYYLALDQTQLQNKVGAEPYPKAGADNPIVDLFVYHLDTKKTTRIDVRDGKPFDNAVMGHYVYNVGWSPDGKEVHFFRTTRRQNVMEFVAADPETGKCRVIVREEWLPSWVENTPRMQYLKDNNRFLWVSERNGFRNFYLYDLSGKLHAKVTQHEFEVANIVRVDEAANVLWYTARDGDNHMKLQLHRVKLDGGEDKRLTDPAWNHTVDIAPDGKHIVDVAQTHDKPPVTRLLDADGKLITELAKSDLSKFDALGLKKVELFTFKAADGVTDLHGLLHKPSNFDPNKKYPLLVTVYAGPATNGARETFTIPSALTEYGFLVASIDSRSAAGRGKRFLDAIYQKLGVTEVDDQAAGVKALGARPYVDKNRVGIHGTSYGGYVSALAVLRHPGVFHAACASSAVTDFRLYDSIYTERYMWLPQENKKGYDAGNAMQYVNNLKGRLMLFYGTADDNVHPANTMQLIRALQRAGKSFDVQVGPDQGHARISEPRMMEFFIENLVMKAS